MFEQTINDAPTIAGNSTGTMLANRYRVVRQLGNGGMGSVWLVEDVKLDNKAFAVKMLPAILVSNRRAYEQVKREALIALKLVHPNIVQFRALEEAAEGGNPFLVMDYVDGRTLDDYLAEKGKLTEEETLRVLRPIAAALDYAHAKGVVHRDVKPGNVMIAKDGTPYILDFGIAREIQETMTRVTGKLSSGTLMYMSPEQLHGAVPKAAQDVYSFAAMAYECLTGAPPFSRGQIEYQIDHDAPAPINLPTGGSAVRGSGTLAASVMAGLAKKPEDRPATCAAVLAGDGFSHKERKETGESRLDATIRGSGALAASPGRAGAPRPPQGDGNVRVEHVERVEGKAPDNDNGKVSRKEILIALLGLAVIGGLWWELSKDEPVDSVKKAEMKPGLSKSADELHVWSVEASRRTQAMKSELQRGIVAYRALKDKWPGKIEDWASQSDYVDKIGYLSNADYDRVVRELLKVSADKLAQKGRVLNPAKLLVMSALESDGGTGGMDYNMIDPKYAKQMSSSEMTVVYPNKETGKAYRYVIEYNTESDSVTVMTQSDYSDKTGRVWTGSEVWR